MLYIQTAQKQANTTNIINTFTYVTQLYTEY
jgi:hypothetical protein